MSKHGHLEHSRTLVFIGNFTFRAGRIVGHDTPRAVGVLSLFIIAKLTLYYYLLLPIPTILLLLEPKGEFKGRVGYGLGMVYELVLAVVILNLGATLWVMRRLVMAQIEMFEALDHRIAAVIQELIEKGLPDMEPVSPIQAAIANMISQNLQNPIVEATVRDASGKFA